MVTSFRIKLSLLTPFAMTAPLTLDGLLSAAIANATGLEGEDTLPHMPLEMEHGIFKGSSMFVGTPRYRHMPVSRVMSLKGERDLSTAVFRPNGKHYVAVDQKRGPHKANLSAYPGILADDVRFWGVGDAKQVEYLLSTFIPGIGKRASGGAGEISNVVMTETDADYSWRTASGAPARPLPLEVWELIGGDSGRPVAPFSVRVPYWRTEKVMSVFPTSLTA